jgi:transketolase
MRPAESMRDRFIGVTADLMDEDPRAALVLADISYSAFAATGVVRRHSERVINVGIREQAMIGVSAGLALEGLRPIVHSYAPFLVERPFEQIKIDLGHQGLGAVLVSVGASYDWAEGGGTHHAPGDVGLLATLPDWEIHVPGHPEEAEALLRRAVARDDRVYIRLAEDSNRSPRPLATDRMDLIRRGRPGAPVVIAVGPMLDRVVAATAGIDATVLYAITVRPFDHATLTAVATGSEVVLVEPYLEGTSVSEVTTALRHLPHRTLAIGVPRLEQRRYGSRHDHDRANGLDVAGIRARIEQFLGSPVAA